MPDENVTRPDFGWAGEPAPHCPTMLTTAIKDLSRPMWIHTPRVNDGCKVLLKATTGRRFKEWAAKFGICAACGGLGLVSDDNGQKYTCPKCGGKKPKTWGDPDVRASILEEIVHGWRGLLGYNPETDKNELVEFTPENRTSIAETPVFDEWLDESLKLAGRRAEDEAKN